VLAGKNDIIFCDRDNHASIFDGARLSYGALRKYRHNDLDELERLLAEAPADKGKLIVSDGVFSMLGDMVDLPRLRELADRYGAAICIDDAHGIGVVGEGGRGTASHFGTKIELLTGTFSKSFGSLGGFVAGDRLVVDFVKYTARPMIFSAAMTPSNAAAALAAVEVMRTEPEHMARLQENVDFMRDGLRRLGVDVHKFPTAILPIVIGGDLETFGSWRRLFDEGVFVNAVVAPAVQPGMGMLRTSYMATHTREQLERCLAIFGRVLAELHLVQ
jgi:7-keto-8-aminopelargonate synthetase-like enzyme